MNLSVQAPSRVRYGVLGFACALSMITYLDRVCMGTVMGDMQREFGLSDQQRGLIFGAFALSYALFEVPTGWLGDKYGPKKTLIRIVLWWSIFTALTGLIYPTAFWPPLAFLALLVVRFLFGMGEAGAYPNIARAFHNWFPFQERGTAKGAVWMAGRFAGGVTPLIVLALIFEHRPDPSAPTTVVWRHTFWIFGAMGIAWSVVFWWWFRDTPEQKPGVNTAELALIHAGEAGHQTGELRVPWRRLLLNPNLWALCGMYCCAAYGWYFNITYLPEYLRDQFGLEKAEKWTTAWWTFTLMAGLPLLFGSLACLVGGVLTDFFIKRTGNRKWGRRLFGVLGHGLCAVCMFVAMGMQSAWPFVLAMAFAAFWNDMTMGASWASCLDIGRRYSGIVSGCMNMVGNFGGFLAGVVTGQILDLYTANINKAESAASHAAYVTASQPAWRINFLIFGSVYIAAVFFWLMFDATKPIEPDDATVFPNAAS